MKSACLAVLAVVGVVAMSSDVQAGCFGQQQIGGYQQAVFAPQYAARPIVVRQQLGAYSAPVQTGCFQQPLVVRQPIALRQRFVGGRLVQPIAVPFGGGGVLGNVRRFVFGF